MQNSASVFYCCWSEESKHCRQIIHSSLTWDQETASDISQQPSDIQPLTIIISHNSAATASSHEASGEAKQRNLRRLERDSTAQSWQCWIMPASAFKYSAFPFHQTIHWTIRNGEYFLSGIIDQWSERSGLRRWNKGYTRILFDVGCCEGLHW